MQKYIHTILPMIAFAISQIAMGEVSTKVYLADGKTHLELADPNTPFVYRDIMVGTKLAIVISSDAAGSWSGSLVIIGENRNYGLLSARDYNDTTHDWAGSRFPAAGNTAYVWEWTEPDFQGFDLESTHSPKAGDWFIIDYTATSVGVCNIAFYDHTVSWVDPVYYLTFTHVPTCDFNSDDKVNFTDFAVFTSSWRLTDCNNPSWCKGADLNMDDNVDGADLLLFAKYWLESTE